MNVILPDPSVDNSNLTYLGKYVAEPGGVSSFPDDAVYLQPGLFMRVIFTYSV